MYKRQAFACDIDDKCVGVAYENAALNGVGKEHYTVRAGDVLSDKRLQKEFGGDYDVIVANIVADVIIALAPQDVYKRQLQGTRCEVFYLPLCSGKPECPGIL